MPHIAIISSSIRAGRQSNRVALYFKNFLETNQLATAEILDLAEYQFPIFEERLKFMQNAPANAVEFATKIKQADGVIIVAPEYNGSFPASLKNVIDLLNEEWKRKPVAFSTVSAGAFGGMQLITNLQFVLWKMQAWTVPAMFPVPKVQEAFDENGTPGDAAGTDKRAGTFINELLWCIEAAKRMKN